MKIMFGILLLSFQIFAMEQEELHDHAWYDSQIFNVIWKKRVMPPAPSQQPMGDDLNDSETEPFVRENRHLYYSSDSGSYASSPSSRSEQSAPSVSNAGIKRTASLLTLSSDSVSGNGYESDYSCSTQNDPPKKSQRTSPAEKEKSTSSVRRRSNANNRLLWLIQQCTTSKWYRLTIKCDECDYSKSNQMSESSSIFSCYHKVLDGLKHHLQSRHKKQTDNPLMHEYMKKHTIITELPIAIPHNGTKYSYTIKCPHCDYSKTNYTGPEHSQKDARSLATDAFRCHVKRYHPKFYLDGFNKYREEHTIEQVVE